MSVITFPRALKSTIDVLGKQAAESVVAGMPVADIDNTVDVDQLLADNKDVMLWQLLTSDPDPKDPMYTVQFAIGVSIRDDPSGYRMMEILGKVADAVKEGSTIDIYDYGTEVAPTVKDGFMFISEVATDPQLDGKVSGVRYVTIRAKAVRT